MDGLARWIGAVVLLGCGPAVPGGDGESTGGSSSTTSTQTVTSVGSTSSTSIDPTTSTVTTDDTTTSGDTTSGGSTTSGCGDGSEETGEPPELCGPEPDDEGCGILLDDPSEDEEPVDVDADCVVGAREENASQIRYTLVCDEPSGEVEHTLDLDASCASLVVRDAVHLRAMRNYPLDFGLYQFVAVRDTSGSIVLALFQPDVGGAPDDVDAFYAPISVAAADMGCEAVPNGPLSCGFISEPCPADETRLGLDFTDADDMVRVWSQQVGELGPLRVRGSAQRLDPVAGGECWYELPHTRMAWEAWRPAKK